MKIQVRVLAVRYDKLFGRQACKHSLGLLHEAPNLLLTSMQTSEQLTCTIWMQCGLHLSL